VPTEVDHSPERARQLARSWLRDRSGATAIEYGLVAGLVSVMIVTGTRMIGTAIAGFFMQVASQFP
jgi:pilus assembly protein Flp/PilA